MQSLDEILAACACQHGHLCAGQLLGARMALLGCRLLGLDDPIGADRKKLIVWVEIDRCMADAVCAATGVRLGRRSLKFFDYGKVAATFLHTETGEAVRLVALDSARALAEARYPNVADKKERQLRTYREATDAELFSVARVRVAYGLFDRPGRPHTRIACTLCGEGINDGREIKGATGQPLCRPCATGGYYELISSIEPNSSSTTD